jgi:hypothetical protein
VILVEDDEDLREAIAVTLRIKSWDGSALITPRT